MFECALLFEMGKYRRDCDRFRVQRRLASIRKFEKSVGIWE